MADVQLTSPRLRVVLADDSIVEVQCTNADLVRFDLTRGKHKWPAAPEAPMLWITFLAWAALKRTHGIAEAVTWEAFSGSALEVTHLNEDEDDGDAVDPSPSAVELD